jgi:hypothetical protein
MRFLVIETFRNAGPVPVYRRFRDQGRLAPEGLIYLGSWITDDFEVLPVLTSAEAQARVAPLL